MKSLLLGILLMSEEANTVVGDSDNDSVSYTVTISKEQYDELLERDRWLDALEAAGVDNWQGYDFAHEIFDTFK